MTIVYLRDANLAFGASPLLDGAQMTLEAGERVCLLGRNGAGKTTLLSVLQGSRVLDGGDIVVRDGIRVATVPQEVPMLTLSVREVVAAGAGPIAQVVAEYEALVVSDNSDSSRVASLQARIDAEDGWNIAADVGAMLQRLALDGDALFETLSGGQKRRTLLARALLGQPDLLILDEPTNHLDVGNIDWLEQWLLGFRGACLFTTHDRSFMQRVGTRILELDRGELTSWPGDYQNFLRRRAERDNAESLHNARADKMLAQEERWIRQGIKARRTRNEGRVRRLLRLRETRSSRRERAGTAKISRQSSAQTSKMVAEASAVRFGYGTDTIIEGLDLLVSRGDRIGLIGANGSGKTTLLRLLIGQLEPSAGTIRHGENLAVAYFDQHRLLGDPEQSVRDYVADGSDYVGYGDKKRHVISYLSDFLFSPGRVNGPIRALSGGERARLALARQFAEPANVLVMDEPTNDLDVETLELLEEQLLEFDGTLLLVSHDRTFMDNVVTSTLELDGTGRVREYVGGYSDYLRQRVAAAPAELNGNRRAAAGADKPVRETVAVRRKLGFNEKRELTQLPERIAELESKIESLNTQLADPMLYKESPDRIGTLTDELARVEAQYEAAFLRWTELEELANP